MKKKKKNSSLSFFHVFVFFEHRTVQGFLSCDQSFWKFGFGEGKKIGRNVEESSTGGEKSVENGDGNLIV